VIILYQGKVVAADTPENLARQTSAAKRLVLQVEGPTEAVVAFLETLAGVSRVILQPASSPRVCAVEMEFSGEDLRKKIPHLLHQKGWGLLEMRLHEVSLEEVFIHLVTREENHARG